MRFDEALVFVSFVQVQPKNDEQDEMLYSAVKKSLGFSKESFENAKNAYRANRDSMSPDDIADYLWIINQLEKTKEKAEREYAEGIIDEQERNLTVLKACKKLEEQVNAKVVEPIKLVEKTENQEAVIEHRVEMKTGKAKEERPTSKIGKIFGSVFKK